MFWNYRLLSFASRETNAQFSMILCSRRESRIRLSWDELTISLSLPRYFANFWHCVVDQANGTESGVLERSWNKPLTDTGRKQFVATPNDWVGEVKPHIWGIQVDSLTQRCYWSLRPPQPRVALKFCLLSSSLSTTLRHCVNNSSLSQHK